MTTDILAVVIAISFGTFSIVGVMISLFLWNRGESNSDRRHHSNEFDELRDQIIRLDRWCHKLERRK